MKFHIKNMVLLGAIVSPVCAAPKKVMSKLGSSGVLVFQRGHRLEAISLRGGRSFVLRKTFLLREKNGQGKSDWRLSSDGCKLAFSAVPDDVNFFRATSYRSYLWTVPFNNQPKVLLPAYGPRATRLDYNFADPFWSFDGSLLAVSRNRDVALYNVGQRREIWSSNSLSQVSFPTKHLLQSHPALSPNRTQLLCIATEEQGDNPYTPELPKTTKAAATRIVLFDLKRAQAQVVASVDDQFSITRYSFQKNEEVIESPVCPLQPQFAWHPALEKIAFVAPASAKIPTRVLLLLDLKTKKLSRLTKGAQDDFSPQWSLDGKQLYWIRGSVDATKSSNNQIFRANADGSNATPILPQLRGVTRIQLLRKIADWSRYRNLAIEPLAGEDK